MTGRLGNIKKSKQTSALVTDQRGLYWSFVGIFLSLFVGLLFKAIFSPDRVYRQLSQAATRIHPSIQVEFESAYLSLSDGLFPELAVVVDGIKVDSSELCWRKPLIRVDSLRLPLKISELLHGKVELAEVNLGHVDLEFREKETRCDQKATDVPVDSSVGPPSLDGKRPSDTFKDRVSTETQLAQDPPSQNPSMQNSSAASPAAQAQVEPSPSSIASEFSFKATRRNPVERVQIRSLRILKVSERWAEFEFRRMDVRVRDGKMGREAALSTDVVLPVEVGAGELVSTGKLELNLNENQNLPIAGTFRGVWREGTYRLSFESDSDFKQGRLSVVTEHLPMGPVLGVLGRQNVIHQDLYAKSAWISMSLQSKDIIRWQDRGPYQLEKLKIEGDIGEIETQKVEIQTLTPFVAKPFSLGIRGVSLEELLKVIDQPTQSPSISKLGTFNGEIRYQSKDRLQIFGEHSGLEFVFSNRGVREHQVMSLIGGEAELSHGEWSILIDRVRPLDGLFIGKVKIHANSDFSNMEGRLDVDELSLSPSVQKVMTGGGQLGAWTLDGHFKLTNRKVVQAEGLIDVQDLLIENLGVRRTQIKYGLSENGIKAAIFGKRVSLQKPSRLLDGISAIWVPQNQESNAEKFQASFLFSDQGHLSWDLMPTNIGEIRISSKGGWRADSDLWGQVFVEKDKDRAEFSISGSRADPKFLKIGW